MERFIYQNEMGNSIEFSIFSPYIYTKITENVSNSIVSTKHTNRDGESFESSALDTREINLQGSIVVNGYEEALEQNFVRILNPKLRSKLICKKDLEQKEIDVELESLPTIKRNGGTIDFNISFLGLNPYWKGIDKIEHLALLKKKFTFPIVIPKNKGIIFGIKKSILETEVENIGDVSTGFRVVFRARGEVQNIEVSNKFTNEKIKVNVSMQKGDTVEVINYVNRKMVLFNGQKAFSKLDVQNSTFFDLLPGKNLLGYNAEKNAVNLDVIVYYSPLYLGR